MHRLLSRPVLPASLLGFGMLVALVAWADLEGTSTAGHAAALWPVNGIIEALLLTMPDGLWPACLLAGAGGNLAGDWLAHGPFGVAAPLALCNVAEILIAAGGLRLALGPWPNPSRPLVLGAIWAFGAVLGPAVSAVAALAMAVHGAPWAWFLAHATSTAVVLPLGLSLRRPAFWALFRPGRRLETVAIVALCVAASGIGYLPLHPPLTFLLLPPLVLAAVRLGIPGASLALALCASLGALIAFVHHVAIPGVGAPGAWASDAAPHVFFLVFFLAVAASTVLPLGAVTEERARALAALHENQAWLRESEALHRLLADHSSDIITRTGFDGVRCYVSPAIGRVLGWEPETVIGADWRGFVHPEDHAVITGMLAAMTAGQRQRVIRYRYRARDGSWHWLESSNHVVRVADGVPLEFVSVERDISERREAEQKLEAANAELAALAMTDGLTGLANRRRFEVVLGEEWQRAMRAGGPLALLLCDVDVFKAYNDTYGHLEGDDCLRAVASVFRTSLRRPGDLAARIGGEEFALLLPGTDAAEAQGLAEAVRAAVEAAALPHAASPAGCVTVSVGVACVVPPRHGMSDMLVAGADQALYEAKGCGRNRVRAAPAIAGGPDVVLMRRPA
ncbi:MAG TPA: diguanylate cyclase [Acetobacteraceae bacterium]|nr:diguanylate cyclase [Acetobacteraceae bacterium]